MVLCSHGNRGHKGSISCVRIKDKTTLVSGSYDNTLHVWDTRHHKKAVMSLFGHTAPVMCLELVGGVDTTTSNQVVTGNFFLYLIH